MAPFKLDDADRFEIQSLLKSGFPGKPLCRAQALLRLADGESVEEIADTLGVNRRTVYYWFERFQNRHGGGILSRLAAAPRSGRPCTAQNVIDPILDELFEVDPRDLGYHYAGWTATLLQAHLKKDFNIDVSVRSIGSAIKRIGVKWKRPRHTLALRPRTWKQSKGGLKEA